jgi:hypothetical protein
LKHQPHQPSRTQGELWARAELDCLRVRRFSPRALVRFLAASQRRANEIRRSRPKLARQEARWALAGAAAWLALAGLRIDPFRLSARRGLAGWAATMLMLDWHLGMVETADGRPRPLAAADAATLLRAWLVPAVAERPAPALCVIGFATDVLDGRLARASEPTRLGRDLEGLVDAAFTAAVLRGCRRQDLLSRPAVLTELARIAVGATYGTAAYFTTSRAPGRRVLAAGRATAPLRAAGALAAVAGRRRLGGALLVSGSVAGIATLGMSARRTPGQRAVRPPASSSTAGRAYEAARAAA